MINNKKVSLIIPCKNEEAALYSMLIKAPAFIDEVIVVDNGSTDNTMLVGKLLGAKVIRENRTIDGIGYGYAHQTGLKHATGDIIVALDGDNTYPIHEVENIITYMEKSESDFVSCSRFPLSNNQAISRLRQFGVRVLNLEVLMLYGLSVHDILSGMWAMTKDTAKRLHLTDGGWNLSPEIKLAAIADPNIHFSEYHISHDVRLNGESKQQLFKTGFQHLIYILQRRLTTDLRIGKQHRSYMFNSMRSFAKGVAATILLSILHR